MVYYMVYNNKMSNIQVNEFSGRYQNIVSEHVVQPKYWIECILHIFTLQTRHTLLTLVSFERGQYKHLLFTTTLPVLSIGNK